MIRGNKGEWSEIYALFKLLGDKRLFLGNKDIERIEGLIYPIIKILRTENNKNFEYSIKDEIILISGTEEVLKILDSNHYIFQMVNAFLNPQSFQDILSMIYVWKY